MRRKAGKEPKYELRRLRQFLERLASLEAQSNGYHALHDNLGEQLDYDLATDYLKRSMRCQGLAYVYGFAALRMNRLPDGSVFNEKIEEFARQSLERIERGAVNFVELSQLVGAMKAAEAMGWVGKPNLRPIVVIGANWCPDTAVNVVEVANAFDVRLQLMFMNYVKPSRDSGRRATVTS